MKIKEQYHKKLDELREQCDAVCKTLQEIVKLGLLPSLKKELDNLNLDLYDATDLDLNDLLSLVGTVSISQLYKEEE